MVDLIFALICLWKVLLCSMFQLFEAYLKMCKTNSIFLYVELFFECIFIRVYVLKYGIVILISLI